MTLKVPDQDEVHATLLRLTMECARPSWRFRMLFSAEERQLLGYGINGFMSQRQANLTLNELERRYGVRGIPGNEAQSMQAGTLKAGVGSSAGR